MPGDNASDLPWNERLYLRGLEEKERFTVAAERERQLKEEAEFRSATYKPNINTYPGVQIAPLQQRINASIRQRELVLKQKEEIEKEKLKPKMKYMNKVSRQMVNFANYTRPEDAIIAINKKCDKMKLQDDDDDDSGLRRVEQIADPHVFERLYTNYGRNRPSSVGDGWSSSNGMDGGGNGVGSPTLLSLASDPLPSLRGAGSSLINGTSFVPPPSNRSVAVVKTSPNVSEGRGNNLLKNFIDPSTGLPLFVPLIHSDGRGHRAEELYQLGCQKRARTTRGDDANTDDLEFQSSKNDRSKQRSTSASYLQGVSLKSAYGQQALKAAEFLQEYNTKGRRREQEKEAEELGSLAPAKVLKGVELEAHIRRQEEQMRRYAEQRRQQGDQDSEVGVSSSLSQSQSTQMSGRKAKASTPRVFKAGVEAKKMLLEYAKVQKCLEAEREVLLCTFVPKAQDGGRLGDIPTNCLKQFSSQRQPATLGMSTIQQQKQKQHKQQQQQFDQFLQMHSQSMPREQDGGRMGGGWNGEVGGLMGMSGMDPLDEMLLLSPPPLPTLKSDRVVAATTTNITTNPTTTMTTTTTTTTQQTRSRAASTAQTCLSELESLAGV